MKEIKLGKTRVGLGYKPYFIADLAANHDGELSRAKDLVWIAKEAGADCAKFQHFLADKIVNDVEQLVKEDSRETNQELRQTTKDIQEDMELLKGKLEQAMTELEKKIDKRIKLALENPLSQM